MMRATRTVSLLVAFYVLASAATAYALGLYAVRVHNTHRCGEMYGGAEEEWFWMTCTCGAVTSRTLKSAHRP